MSAAVSLSAEEARRYARQLVLKGFGGVGQQRLKAARVLVVGAGALGSPVVAYLAASGVGTLGIADFDRVALSNLQRQIAHTTDDLEQPKAGSAARFASRLNPHVQAIPHEMRLDAASARTLLAEYDLAIDGSDDYSTRRAVAAAGEELGKPVVSGAVGMFDGQVTVFAPHLFDDKGRPGPRFSDLYPEGLDPESLPSCEAVGVLGSVAGVVGALMATEAIKLIVGIGRPLIGRLLLYDGKEARFSEFGYKRGG